MLPALSRIAKDSPLPRHFQVRQILLDRVSGGVWKPGDKIPAETEIAEQIGVSKMTVNKAILALTAEGVFLREIGRGTFVAPARQETNSPFLLEKSALQTIEVITSEPTELASNNEYLCALMLAMRCEVSPLEANLMLRQSTAQHYLAHWQERRGDRWVIVAPRQNDVPHLLRLAEARARVVILGATWSDVALPSIDSDNVQGAMLAIEHLAGLGHRNIGLLYADPEYANTRDRILGYRRGMEACGLTVPEAWVMDAGGDYRMSEEMKRTLMERMQRPDCPTAFLAAGAFAAYDLLDVLHRAGRKVPQDISLVSFDDPAALASVSPALTTILQPLEAMGREAMSLFEIGEAMTHQSLPCRLVVRGTTAPPATG